MDLDCARNSRSAMQQAEVAADNVLNSIERRRMVEYVPQWWERGIDLTLGLVRTHVFTYL